MGGLTAKSGERMEPPQRKAFGPGSVQDQFELSLVIFIPERLEDANCGSLLRTNTYTQTGELLNSTQNRNSSTEART